MSIERVRRRRRTPEEARLEVLACARARLLAGGPDSVTLKAVADDLEDRELSAPVVTADNEPEIKDLELSAEELAPKLVPPAAAAEVPFAKEDAAMLVRGTDKVIAIITDTRPDGPLGRRPIAPGTKFEIPQNKITYRGGNPTGHIVIFVNQLDAVLCYVMNGGV